MTLRDDGFLFCIRPDKQDARWVHPAERNLSYRDWTDVTDWPDAKLVDFLTNEPEQKDLFEPQ